ncbi:MAG: hypothetical protein IPJ65_31695 [Archangiaceae bacterium]|nr:hypothetical protein [Archangiaceae bacterium]
MSPRWCLLVLLALTACPGRLDDPDRFKRCPIDVEVDILQARCGMAGCHGMQSPQNGLDLVSMGVAGRIKNDTSMCEGKPLSSFMIEKVTQSVPTCGSQMPTIGDLLTTAELKCLNEYIANLTDGGT